MGKVMFKQLLRVPFNFRRHTSSTGSSSKEEVDAEQRAGLLGANETSPNSPKSYRSVIWVITRAIIMALGASLVVYVGQSMVISRTGLQSDHLERKSQFLDLIIPMDESSNLTVCQTILSAQVLNYPMPTIVSWEAASEEQLRSPEERLLAQFTHIYSFLNAATPEHEEAMVILLDAPGTWFQLRPEVLLHRYYQTIRRANQRLTTKIGKGVKQSVLFAAQNECALNQDTEVACYAAPRLLLSGQSQQRFPGHGAIIGPIKDVKAIMQRAVEKLHGGTLTDPLVVFGEIFGEQEYQRAILQHGQAWWDWFGSGNDHRIKMLTESNTTYEFGMGLDYDNELGSSLESSVPKKQDSLPSEVHASMPPYWTVSGGESDLPHESSWSDVELLTGMESGVASAMIHQCPSTQSEIQCADQGKESWARFWLHPYARTLYTAAQRLPASMVASVVDDHGREQRFWVRQRPIPTAGAWSVSGQWNHWQDLCGSEATWKAVFQDEKGPWTATDY